MYWGSVEITWEFKRSFSSLDACSCSSFLTPLNLRGKRHITTASALSKFSPSASIPLREECCESRNLALPASLLSRGERRETPLSTPETRSVNELGNSRCAQVISLGGTQGQATSLARFPTPSRCTQGQATSLARSPDDAASDPEVSRARG